MITLPVRNSPHIKIAVGRERSSQIAKTSGWVDRSGAMKVITAALLAVALISY